MQTLDNVRAFYGRPYWFKITSQHSIFEKAVITSPMWGIEMPPILKSGAPIIMSLISLLGKMETYAPTTNSETRILHEDYESIN